MPTQTKKWTIKSKDGKMVNFFPVFDLDAESGDIQCKQVKIKEGENEYILNFLDLMMFCYFMGNEEQRIKLANVQFKKVRNIPYKVTFKINEEEKKAGIAKRLIEVPIDEIIMAYAKHEAKRSQFMRNLKS